MIRFYIVPKISVTVPLPSFEPKYFGTLGIPFSSIDYGPDNYLVGADTDDTQHAFLSAQSDVFAIPPLDTTITNNSTRNQIRTRLEALSIPGTWVETSTTYRFLVRRIAACALILQRMFGALDRHLFGPGVTLGTTLTTELISDFTTAGQSLSLDTTGINATLTVRQVILLLADQLPPFTLVGETF